MADNEDFLKIATIAGQYAALCGRLQAIVQWCVEHEGETLSDNRRMLEIAKRVLADVHAQNEGRHDGFERGYYWGDECEW